MFMPVPPKISLPMITPKAMPSATCHKGMVGGRTSGNSIPVTKNPSLISCLRTTAKRASQFPPTAKVTISTGR